MKYEASFRFTGTDLKLMKTWSGKENPNDAIESFIYTAVCVGEDPHDMLEELRNGQLDKKPLEQQ